jgi:5-formyltetrahydrofolate cyclo-ligase
MTRPPTDCTEPIQPIRASKIAMRESMARHRAAVEPREASQAGSAMAESLLAHPEWLRGQRVGLFAGLPDEPDTRPILTAIQGAGKDVFFPRCRDDGGLAMARVDGWSDLLPSRFGILEPPAHATFLDLCELDLVLLPGVAFDRFGRRLGRGGGFYDRGLARAEMLTGPRRLGVGFAFQVVEHVPSEAFDQPVHGILTERGLIPAKNVG